MSRARWFPRVFGGFAPDEVRRKIDARIPVAFTTLQMKPLLADINGTFWALTDSLVRLHFYDYSLPPTRPQMPGILWLPSVSHHCRNVLILYHHCTNIGVGVLISSFCGCSVSCCFHHTLSIMSDTRRNTYETPAPLTFPLFVCLCLSHWSICAPTLPG